MSLFSLIFDVSNHQPAPVMLDCFINLSAPDAQAVWLRSQKIADVKEKMGSKYRLHQDNWGVRK